MKMEWREKFKLDDAMKESLQNIRIFTCRTWVKQGMPTHERQEEAMKPTTQNAGAEISEWIDAKIAWKMFTLGRTTLTRLAREKKIKSCSLAEDGMDRGKRLYEVESIRKYLYLRSNQ
jgi:hypothetical protein